MWTDVRKVVDTVTESNIQQLQDGMINSLGLSEEEVKSNLKELKMDYIIISLKRKISCNKMAVFAISINFSDLF